MAILETLLLSAGVPILVDLVKQAAPAATRKLLGVSVDDQVKLANVEVERLKALAELDEPGGTPSQWVIDLRGSFRYLFSGILILVGAGLAIYGAQLNLPDPSLIENGLALASAPTGFILGERMMLSFKR